ncbi:cytochrome P450 [Panaeolus papilionaceus]|nr:cytochrome P450 [Panaeolus papilionaceus]
MVDFGVPAQCTTAFLSSWALWKVLRAIFLKSDVKLIPGPPSESYIKGVFLRIFDVNGWDFHRKMWDTYGPVIRIRGLFGEEMLYTYDPKAMHHILVKDQSVFQQAETMLLGTRVVFGNGLMSTTGHIHSRQRRCLNPVFSTAHMRQMAPMFYDVAHRLERSLMKQVKDRPREIDMAFWMGRTSLELIGQAGFGHSFDDLSEDYVEHDYTTALKQLLPVAFRLSIFRVYFLKYALKLGSPSFQRTLVDILPVPAFKEMRDIIDTLHHTSLEIYKRKKQALLDGNLDVVEQVSNGNDILSILMKHNMEALEEDKLSDEEIYAQISTFTFAGTDTTSNAVSRILWLLAQHKDAQSRLRAELREAMANSDGDVPHDELVALPYLDAICRETLRLYSPANQLMRQPVEDIVLPLSRPITLTSGRTTSEIFVPKGTKCIVSLIGSNRNTELWGDDAHDWKPERWMGDLKDEVQSAKLPGVYSHLMTFSAGGRGCIGFKFSQLEMKVVLATLISRFEFSISQEIKWQMSSVVIPVVKEGDQSKPSMPLMVSLAN